MKIKLKKFFKKFKKEVKSNPTNYLFLAAILIGAFFIRVYRVSEVLGFYFDQGRDALVIWDLWHNGKFFLVGPTTGIAGIFRGPFYYYLIAPFYLLGGGNPVWPAVFLAFLSTLSIALLYHLGVRTQDRTTGIIAALLASFSFYIVLASRWLSNPTPMLFLSMILVWMMFLVTEGKKWAWVVISLVAGLSLFHFGSAGEVFYFPAILIFAIWQKKNLPNKKYLIYSLLALFLTVFPLIAFDIRHGGILMGNIKKFLLEEESFKTSFWDVVQERLVFYYHVFTSKIFQWRTPRENSVLMIVAAHFLAFLPSLWKKKEVKIILLLLASPILGLLFFQGNFGNIYDYYLTGYYLIFILLFSVVLGRMWRFFPGKVFVLGLFVILFTWDGPVLWSKLSDGLDGPHSVGFGNELEAVDWIFEDANNNSFNVDVYVPPVIPYAYDYLFLWQGTKRCGDSLCGLKLKENVTTLYTLYEVDPPHPDRLEAWFERQSAIGEIEKEIKFGGITVQKRRRL